jgi:hypothetical protein
VSFDLQKTSSHIGKGIVVSDENNSHVVVVDVKMHFWSMVTFMVKAAIAAIPAMIILAMISAAIAGVLSGLFAGL